MNSKACRETVAKQLALDLLRTEIRAASRLLEMLKRAGRSPAMDARMLERTRAVILISENKIAGLLRLRRLKSKEIVSEVEEFQRAVAEFDT